MRLVAVCLVLLVVAACFLLETVGACNRTSQKVGELILPDNQCPAGCRVYDVNVAWDGPTATLSWQYVSLNCTACPQGGVALACGD